MAIENPNKIPANNDELAELLTAAIYACNMAGEVGDACGAPNKVDPTFHVSAHDALCDALRIVNPKLLECYIANGWAVTVDYMDQERFECDVEHSHMRETPTSNF